jgi:hypothetical protein
MSLVVSAYWRDSETGAELEFTDWTDGHYMAGPENARTNLWGSDAVKQRWARFLPQLADSNLWVAPQDLDAFVKEVSSLLADVTKLRMELVRGPDCLLPFYLNNFLRAAEFAASRNGGVNIT